MAEYYYINNNDYYQLILPKFKEWGRKYTHEEICKNHIDKVYYQREGYRYIKMPTSYPGHDFDLHYFYRDNGGRVTLNFEREFRTSAAERLRSTITKATCKNPRLEWLGMYSCAYNLEVYTADDLLKAFSEIRSIFNPIIAEYLLDLPKAKLAGMRYKPGKKRFTEISDEEIGNDVNKQTLTTFELPFDKFRLPPYQRTYKWEKRQVNQLISDVISFTGPRKTEYRLGTIVLNKSDIVDGQQRLVTISLILAFLQKDEQVSNYIESSPERNDYIEFFKSVNSFLERTSYDLPIAKANVMKNITAIRDRQDDLGLDFFKALLHHCVFTVVNLKTIPEAFQFFDSQNARGKDLEPHDLLKAYHLRAIGNERDVKKANAEILIDEWQGIDTDELVQLFLCLYRIRVWIKGESARFFEKEDVGVFKGLTLSKNRRSYNCYEQSRLLYYTLMEEMQYAQNAREFPFQIDGVIINGKSFFEMIMHYDKLYRAIHGPKNFKSTELNLKYKAGQIIKELNTYSQAKRIGDIYSRQLFDALLLYYYDRFGDKYIDKAVAKIFVYAYGLRISKPRLYLATVDNEAMKHDSLFRCIRDAVMPEDVVNYSVDTVKPHSNCNQQLLSIYQTIKNIDNGEQKY